MALRYMYSPGKHRVYILYRWVNVQYYDKCSLVLNMYHVCSWYLCIHGLHRNNQQGMYCLYSGIHLQYYNKCS